MAKVRSSLPKTAATRLANTGSAAGAATLQQKQQTQKRQKKQSTAGKASARKGTLAQQLQNDIYKVKTHTETGLPSQSSRSHEYLNNNNNDDDDDENAGNITNANLEDDAQHILDEKMSRKVLAVARAQQLEEIQNMQMVPVNNPVSKGSALPSFAQVLAAQSSKGGSVDNTNDIVPNDNELDGTALVRHEDQAALERFFPQARSKRRTLAEFITTQMERKAFAGPSNGSMLSETNPSVFTADVGADQNKGMSDYMDPRVRGVYEQVGQLLSRYRSGKLPKALSMLPTLASWEQLLLLTRPDKWSPHALCAATSVLVGALPPAMALRYIYNVLLPRLRDEIAETGRLNVHSFNSLKRALYRPAAFFKGIVIPLCEGEGCTLKEACVVGAMIARCSIPMLHVATAIMQLCALEHETDFGTGGLTFGPGMGGTLVFLRVLVDKKYALPIPVIDQVCAYLCRLRTVPVESLPVLWHQLLLSFVQRYKNDLTASQRSEIIELIRMHRHPQIATEVMRELHSAAPPPMRGFN